MTEQRPIRWLHLSDLHLGCRGEALWWQMEESFERDVREMADRLGSPDLLLVTGDLTFSGREEELGLVDRFLDALFGWLRDEAGGPEPLLVTIPGNHDLRRPERAFPFKVLEEYHEAGSEDGRELDRDLWKAKDVSFVEPLFGPYQEWFQRRVLPSLQEREGVEITTSHFPGDLTVEAELSGFPLAIVGLNSTWQQYRKGDFEHRLLIPAQQFHAALPRHEDRSPLEIFQRCPRALLLLHHPPAWLAPRGREIFDEAIYPPGRFDACLYGHLHRGRSTAVSVSGGRPRCFFQSPSLFGLEHYGTADEERAMGYAWGELSPEGVVRVWPRASVGRGGGEKVFLHDQVFEEDPDGTVIGGWTLELPETGPAEEPDLTDYLKDLVERTSHISVSGIASATKGVLRHPIESLYTPLSSRVGLETHDMAMQPEGRVTLPELLPAHDRLLLEGQPGAGKTTFLRLVASMLARDLLGQPHPAGGAWRSRHLGLSVDQPARVPVLLRVSELVALLLDADGPRHRRNNRLWLLELLDRIVQENDLSVPRGHWERLLEEGDAVLLLDGLDEAGDERLRERIFDIFRDACTTWRCPVVVTSRPLQTGPLREMGFHHARIEPFGDREIDTFLERWVTALHTSEAGPPGGEARRYAKTLSEAILGRPRVRRMATNPVMLTCLCVVHWNEGRKLPEGRARVYRAVLKWLIKARSDQREKAGFDDFFAERALALLALAMMTGPEGKRAVLDLGPAAETVAPLLKRELPNASDEELRQRARDWVLFECLGSGVIEEIPGRRIRFWHLTFQEFLAARQLAWMRDEEEGGGNWWPVVAEHLDDAQWRETVELFPGILLDEGGMGRVDLLLERVANLRGDDPDLATEARVAGILGRLIPPLEILDYRPSPEIAALWREALDRALEMFTVEGARKVPVETRRAAAEALGQAGDPRLAPERDNFLEVPGPGGFELGKYPVTVEEYQRFVEEGRGYEVRGFWSATGWAVKTKEGWVAPEEWLEQLAHPNRPVVGLSWYEAEAYCHWLGQQGRGTVRLPTSEEWQRAASPANGEYPWGKEEPDEERANFGHNVGEPTPVGLYPEGDGPYGHCDLAGNVWEWCRDAYRPYEKGAGNEDSEPGRGASRVLRGGSFYGDPRDLRAADRLGDRPVYRDDDIGFRVLRSSSRGLD